MTLQRKMTLDELQTQQAWAVIYVVRYTASFDWGFENVPYAWLTCAGYRAISLLIITERIISALPKVIQCVQIESHTYGAGACRDPVRHSELALKLHC